MKYECMYVVTFQFSFTRYVIVKPNPYKELSTITEVLIEDFILTMALCTHCFLVGGLKSMLKSMLKLVCVHEHVHPETDGRVEKWFSTYLNLMSTLVNSGQVYWDQRTPYVAYAYNQTEHPKKGLR